MKNITNITTIFLTVILVLTASVLSIEAQEGFNQNPKINKPTTSVRENGEANFGVPAVNDNFADSTPLTLTNNTVSLSSDNAQATKEINEPNHAENAGGKSVWFSYTPQTQTVMRIRTKNTFVDTLLAVYSGASVGNLTLIGWNDDCQDNCTGNTSTVDLMLSAGQTYYIAVDGYYDGTSASGGAFDLEITALNAPLQDNFANAYNLGTTFGGSIAGTNFNATAETGEPAHSFNAATKSVWYKWTPSATYSVDFELTENFNSALKIYRAFVPNPTFAQLQAVGESNDLNGYTTSRYRATFHALSGVTYYIAVDGHDAAPQNSGSFQLKFYKHRLRYSNRFTVQEHTDLSVFRPSQGYWYTYHLSYNDWTTRQFGTTGDVPIPADYDGNGYTDYAVTRNENGKKFWYINPPQFGSYFYGVQWGLDTDKAITGDFDNDGVADLTAIRQTPNGLVWYVLQSSNQQLRIFLWGLNSDKPVIGDFDGDGATDVAVTRNEANVLVWYILKSGYGSGQPNFSTFTGLQFGFGSDSVTPEDYDGDGKTDIAVFRPGSFGNWYILRSSDNSVQTIQFGTTDDKPQPADYDGDGKGDVAVFRPSNGTWYTSQNPATNYGAVQWGLGSDIPLSSFVTLSQ